MTVNKAFFIFCTVFTFFCAEVSSQSKNSLLNEKKELQKKISNTNKILSETRKEKSNSQAQLNAIRQQIINKEAYINNLQKEVNFLNKDIGELKDVISSMESDLDFLKREYADMVYTSYKAHNNFNKISYLFASNSFNQLIMRVNYLEQFTEARNKQVKKIQAVHDMLDLKYQGIAAKYKEMQLSLVKMAKEKSELESLKNEQTRVVENLGQKEQELKRQLEQYKKRQQALEKLIKDIIEKEVKKQPVATKSSTLLSKNFEANKGRLPWPLDKCFISRQFGKQPHPVLKKVYVDNMGIGLQTNPNSSVKCVYSGVVTTVASIPGMGKIVMVKHGEYYTVYAKLKSVSVKSGDNLSAKQIIGQVDTNSEGLTELEFQIWKSKEKVNPSSWLAR